MTVIMPIIPAPAGDAQAGFVPRRLENLIARQLLRPCFPRHREILLLAGFDASDRLIVMERIESDNGACCAAPPQCWRAVACGRIAHVVMAHNHPSGIARPSEADLRSTRAAVHILSALGIELSDHLVFTRRGHFSFRRAGLL